MKKTAAVAESKEKEAERPQASVADYARKKKSSKRVAYVALRFSRAMLRKMNVDERLMYHIVSGYLRRWSLWNEASLPAWAVGEDVKWQLFQSWRLNPVRKLEDGTEQLHPMSEFENWPYWLVLDLARTVFRHEPFEGLLAEPENLKEAVCDVCDERFSENEEQGVTQKQ